MSLNWLGRSWNTQTKPFRRPSAGSPFLRIEPLEDRAVPATFFVNTTLDEVIPANGKQSLREAITRANTTPGADTIVVPTGVFKITVVGAGENGNLTGDFDIVDTVTIQGNGAGLTKIDGQQLDRVFDVSGTAPGSIKVVLQGLTVRNGNAVVNGGGVQVVNADLVVRDSAVTGNRASQSGGGISSGDPSAWTGGVTVVRTTVARNIAGGSGGGFVLPSNGGGIGTLTIKDSTVRRNTAVNNGGGIATHRATLINSSISGNTAGNSGGGISTLDTATLTNSIVSGNSAGVEGGGIWAAGAATLTNSTVSGNSAGTNGGGIAMGTFPGTATLTNSTISGNTAVGIGGGIVATTAIVNRSTISGNFAGSFGGGIDAVTVTLTRSTVSGNSSGSAGGGIGAAESATLTNSTVCGNTATFGGGIYATAANLLNCTIVENIARTGNGGGVFHDPVGTFNVKNTLIALNLVGIAGAGPDVSGAFTSGGHNLIGDGTGGTGFTNGTNGDQVGTSANPIDPKFGPLANNGGPTKTHALLASSPAIDRGDNAGVPATDQRGAGFPRKKDGNGDGAAIVDIGAFER